MLNRGVSAKSASSVFYEDYNDVDIYIEDSAPGYRKIFKELISRALDGIFAIEQIFPLGDRRQVIAECEKNQAISGRKKVYIIDGDLFLLNNDLPKMNGLFVLPRYCIENYLVDYDAIASLAYEEDPEMEKEEFVNKFNFERWLEHNEKLLLELFTIYAICFKYMSDEQTIGYKITKLVSTNEGMLCKNKVSIRIKDLKDKLVSKNSEEWLNAQIQIINDFINPIDKKLLKFISAKDYIMPLIVTRIQSISKFNCSPLSFKIRLSLKADVTDLRSISSCFID